MTGTVERSLGVGTVSIRVAVMGVVTVMSCKSTATTLVCICEKRKHNTNLSHARNNLKNKKCNYYKLDC